MQADIKQDEETDKLPGSYSKKIITYQQISEEKREQEEKEGKLETRRINTIIILIIIIKTPERTAIVVSLVPLFLSTAN